MVGERSLEILCAIGWDKTRIEKLIGSGVVGVPDGGVSHKVRRFWWP